MLQVVQLCSTVLLVTYRFFGLARWLSGKEFACPCGRCKRQVRSLSWEDPLEEEMATHFSVLAWKVPWTEEPGGLQSMELQSAGHD